MQINLISPILITTKHQVQETASKPAVAKNSAANFELPNYEVGRCMFMNHKNISFGRNGKQASWYLTGNDKLKDADIIKYQNPKTQIEIFERVEKKRLPFTEKEEAQKRLRIILLREERDPVKQGKPKYSLQEIADKMTREGYEDISTSVAVHKKLKDMHIVAWRYHLLTERFEGLWNLAEHRARKGLIIDLEILNALLEPQLGTFRKIAEELGSSASKSNISHRLKGLAASCIQHMKYQRLVELSTQHI